MIFSVISKNTEDDLNLHDCDCSHLYYRDGVLTMEMDWMEVLASHPKNPFSQAHQSGKGKIVFYNPELCHGTLTLSENKSTAINRLEEIDFENFETLLFEIKQGKDDKHLKLFGEFTPDASFLELGIDYKNTEVMWNELKGLSWFEDF